MLPIIKTAHEMGIYVITCDYLPNNYAHKYADEYVNISIINKDAVLAKARELCIDGILSFACDPGVVTAAYVAEKMGLPSAGSYESISILQNKGLFRKFLKENGFNVPKAKSYTSIDSAINDTDYFDWPIIVKPTDSAGSKGVTKVCEKSRLREAIENALKYSHCNEFIIEDFLLQKGFSSDCDSFSVNGNLTICSFNSQRFDCKAANPYTPAGYTWPSSISIENQQFLKSEIQRLINLLNLKTSIYNIETRECYDGKAYIMELSPRGGGNRLAEMVRINNGYDLIKNTIKAALNLPLDELLPHKVDGYLAEIILHSEKSGIFNGITFTSDLGQHIIETDLWVKIGDKIDDFNGANDALGTLVLKFDSLEQMEYFVSSIETHIIVNVI